MADKPLNPAPARSNGSQAIERLLAAIGYPERIPVDSSTVTLRADGLEIEAEERDGRLFLTYRVTDREDLYERLAVFAAGRMLKEDAALAAEPATGGLFLWQGAPGAASAHELLRLFETFTDSCDWWRSRVEDLRNDVPRPGPEEMIMRP